MDTCITVCGDGLRVGIETCDDGNVVLGDGCGAACEAIEAGFTCSKGNASTTDICVTCDGAPAPGGGM